ESGQSSCFFFSSRRRHTRFSRDWSSDVCSSDLAAKKSRFKAKLLRPAASSKADAWTFVVLPKSVSEKLPRRGRTTVEGTLNGCRSEERRVGKECGAGRAVQV